LFIYIQNVHLYINTPNLFIFNSQNTLLYIHIATKLVTFATNQT
jgi:hypothetical protein